VPWAELDREVEPDHLTSLWVPRLAAPVAGEVQRFVELVRRLRAECPWDRQQTHQSLTRHLLEESYEVVEAIDRLDPATGAGDDELVEELGDLLFQVVFHAALGAERGSFDLADVARTVHDKLVRRHPHVFGTVQAETAGEVLANWEEIKKAEKGRGSVMDGLPALPSMLLALKVQKKAASAGLDFEDGAEVRTVLDDELIELDAAVAPDDREAEVGDVLAAAVSLARLEGLDPDRALRMWAERFVDRFREVESQAADEGVEIAGADRATLDRWWREAKRRLAAM
jgi:tetrapyrrole methylase family protein/MazG family protein